MSDLKIHPDKFCVPTCSEADRGSGRDPSSFRYSLVSLARRFAECCSCCLK